jgi:hypothetical protein
LLLAAVGGAAVFLFVCFVLPSLGGFLFPRPAADDPGEMAAQHAEAVRAAWAGKTPMIYDALELASTMFLVGLAIWLVFRLYKKIGDKLDEQGYWDRAIARRDHPGERHARRPR